MGRRGAKRQITKRERNGRASRKPEDMMARAMAGLEQDEKAALSTGLEARVRVLKVPAALSRDQMAGSYVGRLCIQGDLTAAQYDAATSYLQERADYSRAVVSPRQPGAVDLNAARGGSVAAENVDRTRQIVEAHKITREAILAKQIEIGNLGNLFGAVNICLDCDQPADHLVGDLRTALNALVRRYRLTAPAEAA